MSYQQQHPPPITRRTRSRPWGLRWDPAPFPPWLSERFGRGLTRLYLRHYLRAEHLGRQHIPKSGPVILVANHPTMGDPFTLAFGTERWVTWLAFDEALDWPGAGQIMRLYKSIPINLERPRPSSIKQAYGTLARGRVLGMFMEGERSYSYGMNKPTKPGAARMAIRTGATIVPATLSGARRSWPREQRLPKPGKVVVRYHPPIDPSTFRPDLHIRERGRLLTRELERIITSALPPNGAALLRTV